MSARESWRLLRTWDGEPGWNMALDEALLRGADPRPVLRFYTWRPHALSLGYFQRWRTLGSLVDELPVVRRCTGGGAIHHADELTFSIATDDAHPLFRGEVRRSYERVHALIATALARHGVAARTRGDETVVSDRAGTGMCFHESTPLDLVWDGRKGVGSAQRRSGGRVLHHGSIKLAASAPEEGVAQLREHAADLTPAALAEDVRAAFERALGCDFALEEPRASELALARERAAHYGQESFVRRR